MFLPPDVKYGCRPYIYFDVKNSVAGLKSCWQWSPQVEHLWFGPRLRSDFVLYFNGLWSRLFNLTDSGLPGFRIQQVTFLATLSYLETMWKGVVSACGSFYFFTWALLLSPSDLQLYLHSALLILLSLQAIPLGKVLSIALQSTSFEMEQSSISRVPAMFFC
jgi:hypothetical protein